MKKNISLFLILILIMGVVFGAMVVKAGEQVTIRFMGWEASPLETESVRRGLERFMADNPAIKVEYTPVPGDYHSKLLTMMAGNAAPDVFFLGSRSYRDFVNRGVLLDLTNFFDQEYSLNKFVPSDRQKMVVDGKIYGVSSCIVVPQLYYNKDIFDQAGLAYPPSDPDQAWTWEQFVQAAKKLTIQKGGKTVQYGAYGFEYMFPLVSLLFSNEARLFNDDFTECVMNNAQVREVLQSVLELRTKHGVAPEASFLEKIGMNSAQMLQTGRVAMIADGSWALQELSQMDFPVGIGVLPIFTKPATTDFAHLHSVYKGTKHPEAAWKLVSFLSSEWYQLNLIRAGLWLPNRMSLYTEEGAKQWLNEGVHPANFEEMLTYFSEDIQAYPYIFLTQKVEDITNDNLDYYWYDNQPLDRVLATIVEDVNKILNK